ncbi:hypothetical protein CO174_04310 [Candidatus Uhrbacteria bacterium CG_4_9_14_3_um_filter_50_9]|uniref:Uncharacterized protein n=1 Tax=Candidatus Uhrbacteria bacterium CG_4_9_14_3_um_filter_50_9 TaxID=1975035 RepID=A0A2M7XBK6_9BACT|nr:MAG: hypothetical protein CO174_04310 [Candidatus Uhrbacteria bacterium CG_4_9_14_3_um_filter_50_9]
MKNTLLLFSILTLIGVGCAEQSIVDITIEEMVVEETRTDTKKAQIYVQFIQNVHDWVYPEESIATINRIIDLHETYKLPVELHLTDTMTQTYVALAPDLIDRMKTSEYVSVSYHIRPPHPLYTGFDTIGLSEMSSDELYETLLAYEEHELNMETGAYTENPGGYQYLKEVIGYAPRIVGNTTGRYGAIYSQILEEKGARFTVLHEGGSSIEELVHGLYKRPEDTEVKLYEFAEQDYDMEELFETWTSEFDEETDFFVNLKFHENNYYLTDTPFGPIYWDDFPDGRREIAETPYDITATSESVRTRSEEDTELRWTLYEEALQYVSEHRDSLTAINAEDLEGMLETIE